MRIQELDPEKRYIVSLTGDTTFEDAQDLKERLKGFCVDAVVVAGVDIQPEHAEHVVWMPVELETLRNEPSPDH